MKMKIYKPTSSMIALHIIESIIIALLVFFMVVIFLNRKLSEIIALIVLIGLVINVVLKSRMSIKTDDKAITIIKGNDNKVYEFDKIKVSNKGNILYIYKSEENNLGESYDCSLFGNKQYMKLIEEINEKMHN